MQQGARAMTPQIQLFGSCGLFDPTGQRIRLPTRKAWGLLAYLCQAEQRNVPREELAALLWPRGNEAQARASLRQELAVLRRAARWFLPGYPACARPKTGSG